jgi:hypothetical protein
MGAGARLGSAGRGTCCAVRRPSKACLPCGSRARWSGTIHTLRRALRHRPKRPCCIICLGGLRRQPMAPLGPNSPARQCRSLREKRTSQLRALVRPRGARSFVNLADAVLHQCIRPLIGACCAPGHHGYQRACELIGGQARTGHSGHQGPHAPGSPILHRRLIPLADLGGYGMSVTSSIAPHFALFLCSCLTVVPSSRPARADAKRREKIAGAGAAMRSLAWSARCSIRVPEGVFACSNASAANAPGAIKAGPHEGPPAQPRTGRCSRMLQ